MSKSIDIGDSIGIYSAVELQSLLELSPDPLFKDLDCSNSRSINSTSTTLSRIDLDISRISNRLLAMGRCWQHRTDKESHRNNIDELSLFLNTKYGKNYVIWNMGSPDIQYDTATFRNQVINFGLSRALSLSLKNLFEICRSLLGWLMLDNEHVAIVQCKNGKGRTGLTVACFLRYCELFDSTYESFDYFIQRRSPGNTSWVTVTTRRYLRYFNDILILSGRVPNPSSLRLHQVILNTVPNFDGEGGCNPGIEVYQNGKLFYSSRVRQAEIDAEMESSKNDEAHDDVEFEDDELIKELQLDVAMKNLSLQDYNPLVLKDSNHVVFRLENLILDRDVQIRVYHRNEQSAQNITILNLVFNTGFVAPGVIRLRPSDLELPFVNQTPPGSTEATNSGRNRFDRDFSVDIIVTPVGEADPKNVTYENQTVHSRAKNFLKLSQFHTVRPDPILVKPLELQGHRKFFARLALQLRNNDIHLAHEFLTLLTKKPFYLEIDQELVTLGKLKYDKMKSSNGVHKDLLGLFPLLSKEVEHLGSLKSKSEMSKTSLMKHDKDDLSSGLIKPEVSIKNEDDIPLTRKEDNIQEPMVVNPMLAELQSRVKSRQDRSTDDSSAQHNYTQGDAGKAFEPITPAQPLKSLTSQSSSSSPPLLLTTALSSSKASPSPHPSNTIPIPPPLLLSNKTGQIPPPPPPPLPGTTLKAKPNDDFAEKLVSSSPNFDDGSTTSKPKIQTKFHWDEIKDRQKLRNTVWLELLEQIPNYDPTSLDIHKFEELFCVDAATKSDKRATASLGRTSVKSSVQILDLRRINNVGIGLSRFYKRLKHEEIIEAIIRRQANLMSLDDLFTIKPLIPTDEERNLLNLYTGSVDELGAAERFMALASKEVNLAWMVDCLIFERQFDGEVESSSSKLELIIGLLTKIRESPSLKLLLRVVLELGNLTNYDYGNQAAHVRIRGKALGFRMESLMKLQDVKSVDKKTNLLQYLAMTLEDRHPEVLNLPIDFADLAIVRHWDTSALLLHTEELIASYKRIRDLRNSVEENSQVNSFREAQQVFLYRAATELERIGKVSLLLKESWHKTSEYLGEESNDRKPEELFLILDQFFKSFSNSIHTVQSNRKKPSPSSKTVSADNISLESSAFRLPKTPLDVDTASISSSDISGLTRSESSMSLRSNFINKL